MPRKKTAIGISDDTELPDWIDNPDVVTEADRVRLRNLPPVSKLLDDRYPNGWGDSELDLYIIERRRFRLDRALNDHSEKKSEDQKIDDQLEVLMNKYRAGFTRETPNDAVLMLELCRIELGLDELERRSRLSLKKDKGGAADLEVIAKTRKVLLADFSVIEKKLGIDRESRREGTDLATTWSKVRQQSVELIKKRKRDIVCPKCSAKGIVINYGFIVFHPDFNRVQFKFEFDCPGCGERVTGARSSQGYS